MHCSLHLATVHTSNASNSQVALDCQLISATNDCYSGFLPLIMLKNKFIVSTVLQGTFSKGCSVVLKPLCTPLLLKPRGTHLGRRSAAVHVSRLPWLLIHVLKWQRGIGIPAFLRTILLDFFLFFKRRHYGGKILDEILIITFTITLNSLWTLFPNMCFPEMTPPTQQQQQKANKNKQTENSGWALTSALLRQLKLV